MKNSNYNLKTVTERLIPYSSRILLLLQLSPHHSNYVSDIIWTRSLGQSLQVLIFKVSPASLTGVQSTRLSALRHKILPVQPEVLDDLYKQSFSMIADDYKKLSQFRKKQMATWHFR